MIRIPKAKNARTKRILDERAPKIHENPKSAVFVRGNKTGQTVDSVLHDFYALKKPLATMMRRKNPILPFEDATSLEFFAQKGDTSLFMFGNNSKKRPNNLVMGRCFDHHILDMMEFGVENYQAMATFKRAVTLGSKPCFVFSGDLFETDEKYMKFKSLLLDFFRGPELEQINLGGLEWVMSFTAGDDGTVHVRTYRTVLKKSGTRTPRVELADMGPHMDLKFRRSQFASADLLKQAMKVPKAAKPKKVKNVEYDELGNKHGRIHMERQDFGKMQTRKVKALKRKRDDDASEDAVEKRQRSDEEDDDSE